MAAGGRTSSASGTVACVLTVIRRFWASVWLGVGSGVGSAVAVG